MVFSWAYAVPVVAEAAVHYVLPGESLYSVSGDYGVSVNSLQEANNFQDSLIYPGQQIYIPESNYGSRYDSSYGAENENDVYEISRGGSSWRLSHADVDLLARLITAEADGESHQGKVAVGAVVLNRLGDSSFPKSIRDVIYQSEHGIYQFEPVKNGWIDYPASELSLQAARDALGGEDPTDGALYFFVGNKVDNKWLWSRPMSTVIGEIVFTY